MESLQSGRQSTEPYFQVASPLLERIASTSIIQKSHVRLAEVQYQLSVVLRNSVERGRLPIVPRC